MSVFFRNVFITALLCLLASASAHAGVITAESTIGIEGCSGDINCDGFIGIDDLNALLSHWSQNVPPGDPVDPSGDGFVGIDDLNQVLGNWNAGTLPGGDTDTLVGDDGCFPEDPECGGDIWGIAQLNDVLSNWNQFVPPANPNADWSGDGFIGIDDLTYVLSRWNAGHPPALPGEICPDGIGFCDGTVGVEDLNIVLANWNLPVPPAHPDADNSGDGYVGIDDLNGVLIQWNPFGTPPAANTVPEPATLALLGVLTLIPLRRRRD